MLSPMSIPGVAALCFARAALSQTSLSASYSSTLQTMDGFGVSQAFGRASEFKAVTPSLRTKGLDYLFSTETGAGLTIIRNRIGSGGSGDSILPSNPGCPTCQPNYQWNGDDSGQVWFSKMAQSYGVSTIYADAWSAPGFMKTNGDQSNGGYLCGVTGHSCSSGDWRQAFANMLVQYVKYYASEGITITHLGFLNEPDYTTGYSSMQSNGHEAASFLPILDSTISSNGLSSLKLTCCDALSWNSAKTMTSQLLSDGAGQYLDVVTSHMYAGDPNSPLDANGKPKWMTEGADLDSAWCTTWYSNGGLCEGLTWANKIAVGVINAGLSAYIYWEGFEINQYQAASYLVASDGNVVTPSGRLWAFAMWSRFVRPGAQRLSSSGSLSNVVWGAFKNTDGSVVAVFTNNGGSQQSASLAVSGFNAGSASAWITNNSNTVGQHSVSVSGGAATVSIPGRSVVTVKMVSGSGNGGSPPTTTSTRGVTTTSAPPTTTNPGGNNGCKAAHWAQCGGKGFSGCTTCEAGLTCKYSNDWYSQCL